MTAYGWVPPEEIPELRAVLQLVTDGSPRRKWRLLEVACPQQHRLVEVFDTAAGPVVCGSAHPAIGATFSGSRAEVLAMRLTGAGVHRLIDAQCECGGAEIPTPWIVERLGRRRVVWSDADAIP